MRVGILNSGGDVQGINAVIYSIFYSAKKANLDYDFIGFIKGWEGILDKDFIPINEKTVDGISKQGGTILYSVNKGRFSGKVGKGVLNKIPESVLKEAKQNLLELGVDALLVIGGDGTLSAALQLSDIGVPIIGIPKTIDNDLNSTEQTFGFSTAVGIAVEAMDRIQTTALSHERVIFLETMGRHVGWIALYAGLAGDAHAILLPEFGFSYTKLIEFLKIRMLSTHKYAIVVVAEGVSSKDKEDTERHSNSENRLAGVSARIMQHIELLAPEEFDMRNVVLGHTQRGGTPNAEDRIMAKAYGVAAVDAIVKGRFGHMVCLREDKIVTVPISEAVSSLHRVTSKSSTYQTAKALGIYLGN